MFDQVAPLLRPWVQDPWGMLRPPLSAEAVRMSADLACATYRLDARAWVQAGWQDLTVHLDGELTAIDADYEGLSARWKRRRLRARMHQQRNPLGQMLGALRQVEKSDTGKAMVMIHPAPDGRYVVAISFMGTGTRFYDWISNFRVVTQEGVHKGYLQLTRQFEANEDAIEFPCTARALGLERLTLRQILSEMRHPNSRFTLWLTGHSQGSALMQVYAHCKIHEDGVLPAHLVGYGIASPTALAGTAVPNPAAYPIYHILNSDDVVTRCGAAVHLGVCLTYPADDRLRENSYGWLEDTRSMMAQQAVEAIVSRLTDTPACIEAALALVGVTSRAGTGELLELLGLKEGVLHLTRVITGADVEELVQRIARHAAAAYQVLAGTPLDRARVAAVEADIQAAVDLLGLRTFSQALMRRLGDPHHLRQTQAGRPSAYRWIIRYGLDRLIPTVWAAGEPPTPLRTPSDARRIAADALPLQARRRQARPRHEHRSKCSPAPRRRSNTRHRTPELQRGAMLPGERAIPMK